MRVDRFGLEPFVQEIVDIVQHFLVCHFLKGDIQPQHKVSQRVHVVPNRVTGVVASLQEASVVHDPVDNDHRCHPFLSLSSL